MTDQDEGEDQRPGGGCDDFSMDTDELSETSDENKSDYSSEEDDYKMAADSA